jgi:glycosyltransferase involved in cell wall biosynthesis
MINHSFAVIAYRDSPYLLNCLESLKGQTVHSNIYICTSTPSSFIENIAENFDLELFVTEENKGIAHDWNFALLQARTKYVTLAHQDDIYMPTYAESCFAAAEKFDNTLICFTNYTELLNQKDRKNTLMLNVKKVLLHLFMPFEKNIQKRVLKKYFLSVGSPIPCPGVTYNLEMLRNFRFSSEFSINLDWDAWLRMAKMNGRFVYIPNDLLKHRIHPDSETSIGLKSQTRQKEDLMMFKRIWSQSMAKLIAKLYSLSYKSNSQL